MDEWAKIFISYWNQWWKILYIEQKYLFNTDADADYFIIPKNLISLRIEILTINIYIWCEKLSKIHLFAHIQLFWHYFSKRLTFFPLNCLYIFVKNQLTIYKCIHIYTSISWFSFLMPWILFDSYDIKRATER